MTVRWIVSGGAALLTVAACAPAAPPAQTAPAAATLSGTEWRISEIGGTAVIADSLATIGFADGRAAGNGSCNRYFGGYEQDGQHLRFGDMASTMMACPEPAMQQEGRLLKLLAGVTAYAIDGDQLTLTTADGQTIRARR